MVEPSAIAGKTSRIDIQSSELHISSPQEFNLALIDIQLLL